MTGQERVAGPVGAGLGGEWVGAGDRLFFLCHVGAQMLVVESCS
jgi:hypothetical protein